MAMLKDLNASGTTIVMVTHEPDLARNANRILTLKDGQVISDEKMGEFKKAEIGGQHINKKKTKKLISFAELLNYSHEAMLSLLTNKLRSFLSILGVLIGVSAVIAMLAIGTGAQRQVQDTLASMGSNLLSVSTSFRARGISLGSDSVTRFTFEDLAALRKIDSVKYVAPYVSGRAQVVYQNKNWNTSVLGSTPDYQYVRNSIPPSGRFFTNAEVTTRAKVAVIGKTIVDELFPEGNPIGKQVKINKINFIVVGILPEKGFTGFRNSDDQILIPITTAMYRLLGRDYINNFDVQAADPNSMQDVLGQIAPTIGKLHRLSETQMDNIDVRNMADIQKATTDVVTTFAFLLGSIAAVSLLVGGIGIMNIMLVLVMERTHEIGLRKALGAENRDIMVQFLTESVLICVLGGLAGVLLGFFVSFLVSTFVGWYTVVSMHSILLAFTFSVLVGLTFGIWPAMRAARLLPVEALRYE